MATWARAATTTASTKRETISNGLSSLETNIASMNIYPLMPLDATLQNYAGLDWRETFQTFVDGDEDVLEGDVLVVDDVEYPIRAVEEWPWQGSYRKRLLVEQVK